MSDKALDHCPFAVGSILNHFGEPFTIKDVTITKNDKKETMLIGIGNISCTGCVWNSVTGVIFWLCL